MSGYPILTAIIVTPFVGALLLLFTPAGRRELTREVVGNAGVRVATLGCACCCSGAPDGFGGFQFVE